MEGPACRFLPIISGVGKMKVQTTYADQPLVGLKNMEPMELMEQ